MVKRALMTSTTAAPKAALRCEYCDEPILDGERFPNAPPIVHRECLFLALQSAA